MSWPIDWLAARESVGGGDPGSYFPVRTPWASGDHTMLPMPSSSHSGNTCFSGARYSIEYWGWLETMPSTPGRSRAAWIWGAFHSLMPTYRALPSRTRSVKACMVSSSGVSWSYRWHW